MFCTTDMSIAWIESKMDVESARITVQPPHTTTELMRIPCFWLLNIRTRIRQHTVASVAPVVETASGKTDYCRASGGTSSKNYLRNNFLKHLCVCL